MFCPAGLNSSASKPDKLWDLFISTIVIKTVYCMDMLGETIQAVRQVWRVSSYYKPLVWKQKQKQLYKLFSVNIH